MANGWNSGSDREAMLRRVAIVLSSLPAPMASKLLGSIDAESKHAVRRTMSTLMDVDPLERQRAIQAFKLTFQRQPIATDLGSPEGDSLQIRGASPTADSPLSSRVVPAARGSADAAKETRSAARSPLAFLRDVDDRKLARLLTAEHPQTIAFVLASISPEQAARVLPHLGAKLQQETMSRIGRLGEIPETAVAEVAEHFRGRLQEHDSSDRHSLGRQALDAILAAMPKHESHQTTTDLPERDLTHRLKVAEQTWPEQWRETEKHSSPPASSVDSNSTSRRVARSQEEHTLGEHVLGVVEDASQGKDNQGKDNQSKGHQGNDHSAGQRGNSFDSTDEIHRHLIGLRPSELCQALGKVDTRDAMLALCGLPVQVADAALAVLPRSQAKTVRIRMNSLGSLHLREIDRAKEKVAEASLSTLPSPSLQTPLAA